MYAPQIGEPLELVLIGLTELLNVAGSHALDVVSHRAAFSGSARDVERPVVDLCRSREVCMRMGKRERSGRDKCTTYVFFANRALDFL